MDEETGNEFEADDIIKGYEVAKGQYIELDPEELDAFTHTIQVRTTQS